MVTGHWLDVASWPRKQAFSFFSGFDDPWFNLTVEVDIAPFKAWCRTHEVRLSIGLWFVVAQAANAVPNFRYRVRQDQVWVHDAVRVGATALCDDGSFVYVYYPRAESIFEFQTHALAELESRLAEGVLLPEQGEDDLLHCTSIPWLRFTSLKHASPGSGHGSVPKVALGKATPDGDAWWMPVNIEAHHGLVDGLHVGQFIDAMTLAMHVLSAS
ncbi:MAG: chloramphenicol O-acetyltransferase type A [Myxococcota bacterium]